MKRPLGSILGMLVVGLMVWNTAELFRPPMPPADQETFLGTWTGEGGPDGNELWLGSRRISISGGSYGIEGLFRFKKMWGELAGEGSWNYAQLRPDLQLNLVYGNQYALVRVRQLSPDLLEWTVLGRGKSDRQSGKLVTVNEPKPGAQIYRRTAPAATVPDGR